jgi:hypothetical protein
MAMTRRLRGSSAVLLVTLSLLAVSCGGEAMVVSTASSTTRVAGEGGTTVEGGTTAEALPWWQATRRPAERLAGPQPVSVSYTTKTLDLILALSQAVVAGEVLSVEGPFWNEADGQLWQQVVEAADQEASVDLAIPQLYREVAFRVDEVLLDETGTLVAGDSITLLVLGGGGGPPSLGHEANQGVVMHPGDRQVLLLAYMGYGFRENWVDAWQPLFPPVSVLDLVDGRYRPQNPDYALVFGFAPELATGRDSLSLEELASLTEALKLKPLGDFERLRPVNFTAVMRREAFGIETAEPACLNVPRGECS